MAYDKLQDAQLKQWLISNGAIPAGTAPSQFINGLTDAQRQIINYAMTRNRPWSEVAFAIGEIAPTLNDTGSYTDVVGSQVVNTDPRPFEFGNAVQGTTDPLVAALPQAVAETGYTERLADVLTSAGYTPVQGGVGYIAPNQVTVPTQPNPVPQSTYKPMLTDWPDVFAALINQPAQPWTQPGFLAQPSPLNPMAQQVAASAQTSSGQNGTTTVPGLAQPAAQQVSGNTPQLGPYNPQNQMGTWDTQLPSYVINNILDTWNIPVSGRNGAPSSSPASGGGSWFTGNRGRHGWF